MLNKVEQKLQVWSETIIIGPMCQGNSIQKYNHAEPICDILMNS